MAGRTRCPKHWSLAALARNSPRHVGVPALCCPVSRDTKAERALPGIHLCQVPLRKEADRACPRPQGGSQTVTVRPPSSQTASTSTEVSASPGSWNYKPELTEGSRVTKETGRQAVQPYLLLGPRPGQPTVPVPLRALLQPWWPPRARGVSFPPYPSTSHG